MNSDLKTLMIISRISIILAGIIGNIISFIVFSRKTFRNNSINTYCRALAVSDLFIIIEVVRDVSSFFKTNLFFDISNETCKVFYYISMQYSSIPIWILVAFSIDKMLNVKTSPPKILKSKLFQWCVVLGIFIFHLLFYSELLIILKLVKHPTLDRYICNFRRFDNFYLFLYSQTAENCVIPFTIMIVTSIITIKQLIESRRTLEKNGRIVNKQRKIRDMKFAVSSVAFNVVFIIFKIPIFIAFFIICDTFFHASFILFLINCSSNFLIHFATNSIFRREFFAFFKRT